MGVLNMLNYLNLDKSINTYESNYYFYLIWFLNIKLIEYKKPVQLDLFKES
tara:strand:+ start:18 stop:170 length:153 start_codon:yes stop_codon:yes gene_type:complete